MSKVTILEKLEIELGKIRSIASRIDDQFILYLIDMTILAAKREAVSALVASENGQQRASRRLRQSVLQ
jgi:hypothetical protein